MKIFIKAADYIQNLSKNDFEKYLFIFLLCIAVTVGFVVYSIYDKSTSLVLKMKKLEGLIAKTERIIRDNEKMQQKEAQLQQLLEQNKDFNIRTFFEQFCKEQNITPESNQETSTLPIEGSDKFDEVTLRASFKGLTTQSLVRIVDALDKKKIISIKELIVRSEKNKKITIEIVISTMKFKRFL